MWTRSPELFHVFWASRRAAWGVLVGKQSCYQLRESPHLLCCFFGKMLRVLLGLSLGMSWVSWRNNVCFTFIVFWLLALSFSFSSSIHLDFIKKESFLPALSTFLNCLTLGYKRSISIKVVHCSFYFALKMCSVVFVLLCVHLFICHFLNGVKCCLLGRVMKLKFAFVVDFFVILNLFLFFLFTSWWRFFDLHWTWKNYHFFPE